MGVEKDYLMRQLMMLFEVVHKILRHRRKGENEYAVEQIQYFYDCLKIDNDVRELTIEEFIELLEKKRKLSNEHIELVAFVLKEQGELAENSADRKNLFSKSYFLLEKVENESTSFSMDRQMKIAELQEFLN